MGDTGDNAINPKDNTTQLKKHRPFVLRETKVPAIPTDHPSREKCSGVAFHNNTTPAVMPMAAQTDVNAGRVRGLVRKSASLLLQK